MYTKIYAPESELSEEEVEVPDNLLEGDEDDDEDREVITDEQLNDPDFVEEFMSRAASRLEMVDTRIPANNGEWV